METSVLETSFTEQSVYGKTAQFIYDLLITAGVTKEKSIEFIISQGEITVSILDKNKNEEAKFFVYRSRVNIEINQSCLYSNVIAEIQLLAQGFANNVSVTAGDDYESNDD